MKTFNNLFSTIYSFENLYKSYLVAAKAKRDKSNVLRFSENIEENLIKIQSDLIYKTYVPGEYNCFMVSIPKERLIMAAPFRDRVVHHALCDIIEPIFDNRFIYDSYACRFDKGTHKGVARVQQFLRRMGSDGLYCIKGDISKYFKSININILEKIIFSRITDREVQWLIDVILRHPHKNTLNPKGVPVGNLTSQLCANIYLDRLDQFVKHKLQIKYYVRYMDDFIILHKDKKYLRYILKEIEYFIWNELDLKLNPKTSIFPVKHGIDFLGYRIWDSHKIIRKDSIRRIKRAIKYYERRRDEGTLDKDKLQAALSSWYAHNSQANVPKLRKSIINKARDSFGIIIKSKE